VTEFLLAIGFLVGAPIFGGLLSGVDRIVSARMQRRVGPPLLQPYFDVVKLWGKESLIVSRFQNLYLYCYLIFTVFTGVLFFVGGDFLIVLFAFTLADIFFVMAGFVANFPYSHVGAQRELIQMMAHDPVIILNAVGMYLVAGTFSVKGIMSFGTPLIVYLPGLFASYVFILIMKLRKSPFDLSYSHHAHQEIVRGITTDFAGRPLAVVEVAHWYETTLLFAILVMFGAARPLVAAIIVVAVFFVILVIDNATARVKWQAALKWSWLVTIGLGILNIVLLPYIMKWVK
jgi:ech hydrogenase subunit B